MKFCKNLQKVVDISDPEWAPYWTNYKMLKKLIKELPSLVPADDSTKQISATGTESQQQTSRSESKENCCPGSPSSVASSATTISGQHQQHGDKTAEAAAAGKPCKKPGVVSINADNPSSEPDPTDGHASAVTSESASTSDGQKKAIGKSPGEVAFFKLLHSELKKAVHFFERAQEEFSIREERIREGMEIMKKPNSIMVSEKWSLLAKSLYRLYKDLLLLETFAIMTYCSFSKILKKHDKVTGYDTRNAFMANVVNKANFTNYPAVLGMISRCETLYEQVSQHLMSEGKEGLCEDERLFINMIHRLNAQVMDTREAEGAPDLKDSKNKRPSTLTNSIGAATYSSSSVKSSNCPVTSSLRSLVEENDARKEAAQISGAMSDDGDEHADPGSAEAASRSKLEENAASTVQVGSKHSISSEVDLCHSLPKRPRTG